jgi:transketolase
VTPTPTPAIDRSLAELAINTLRTLSIDAVQKANSGHPGLPMGAAPMAYVLWQRHLRFDPKAPLWPDRDRFVLSAGHGSMLLYALLHLAGYDLPMAELERFRQWGSKTPGHPEWHLTPGVEATTGPLGQGAANAVGMAIAERSLAARFNKPGHALFDHHTFALVSDGDVMEGVACEAASLAGHLGLGKLVYLYDANDVTLDGPAGLSFSEDVAARYRACGWHTIEVTGGDRDLEAIDRAIAAAKAETARPSLITIKTTIGFGSPKKAGLADAHGSPLGPDEVAATKRAYGWDAGQHLHVPPAAKAHLGEAAARGAAAHAAWARLRESYRTAHPELSVELDRVLAGRLPDGWDADLPSFKVGDKIATRVAAGKVQNALAKRLPELIGGDADLGGSTKSTIDGGGSFDGKTGAGKNLHFGVREHAMGSICNGMHYHGGVRPFCATFFTFSDYMRPAVRLAALNKQPVVYVWTHDSIGLGEDGPTHQPVEHLAALRAMPNLHMVRPADANEAAAAWCYAIARTDGPTGLVLSRQNLPVLEGTAGKAADLARGGYVVAEADGETPDVILIGTGSELSIALEARAALLKTGVRARVVSLPCWEAFAAQDASYRARILPPAVRARVAIEAGVSFGWREWVGDLGEIVAVDSFGASAPAETLYEKYGLTAAKVVEAVQRVRGRLG